MTTENNDEADVGSVEIVSRYPARELVSGSYVTFGTTPEVVATALTVKGLKDATIEETLQAIKEFLETEVN